MAFGAVPKNWVVGGTDNSVSRKYLHYTYLQPIITVSGSGTLLQSEHVVPGLDWSEVRYAITGHGVTWESFKTEEEALRKAKLVAGKAEFTGEVLVLKVVRRVRPIPKEVEVVDVKD